ncbi:hypothetical protein GIB67_020281 [Kingdonia uniflora]|uniref:Uncharacterized protein n=1 Tax=Kingdonia uniflora TaxID=39325 RepID=A0A7J7P3S3_9MAGN|nr:hypothetical protein GIB67_020281 [Kingdonia uniflora]
MGNSLRCCLACVLPCGALDVIRIVHLSGQVDEIGRPMFAREVLDANPDHVLSKPCSQGVVRRILILSSKSELKRGSIYFLIPSSSLPVNKKKSSKNSKNVVTVTATKKTNTGISHADYYNPYLVSEKKSSRRERRSKQITVWRPRLDCIFEDL